MVDFGELRNTVQQQTSMTMTEKASAIVDGGLLICTTSNAFRITSRSGEAQVTIMLTTITNIPYIEILQSSKKIMLDFVLINSITGKSTFA